MPLHEEEVDPDPLRQFARWFEEAGTAGIPQPDAAALATAGADGAPSVRMVLVKQIDAAGARFYTNYESRKGEQLTVNPRAALVFFWDPPGRQVRLEGPVQRLSREESLAYARSRQHGSQLSALASPQSRPVPSRAWLERRVAELAERYPSEVPLSDAWGGYRLVPERWEFWQAGQRRLHDRLLYTPGPDGGWRIERLAP